MLSPGAASVITRPRTTRAGGRPTVLQGPGPRVLGQVLAAMDHGRLRRALPGDLTHPRQTQKLLPEKRNASFRQPPLGLRALWVFPVTCPLGTGHGARLCQRAPGPALRRTPWGHLPASPRPRAQPTSAQKEMGGMWEPAHPAALGREGTPLLPCSRFLLTRGPRHSHAWGGRWGRWEGHGGRGGPGALAASCAQGRHTGAQGGQTLGETDTKPYPGGTSSPVHPRGTDSRGAGP